MHRQRAVPTLCLSLVCGILKAWRTHTAHRAQPLRAWLSSRRFEEESEKILRARPPGLGIDGAETIIRGTLRYKGFCAVMRGLQELGLFDPTDIESLQPGAPALSWRCGRTEETASR